MSSIDPTLQAVDVESMPGDEASQWEQHLSEQTAWDHFVSFSPEAIQWTYNV